MAQADTIEHKIADALKADAEAGHEADEATDVTVLFDVFAWTEPAPPGSKARVIHHHATRGDLVTVERGQAIRGVVLGAVELADGSSSATSGEPLDLIGLDAEELGKVKAEDVLAYINQHAGDEAGDELVAEVAEVEATRGAKARATILKAAGYTADEVAAVKAG